MEFLQRQKQMLNVKVGFQDILKARRIQVKKKTANLNKKKNEAVLGAGRNIAVQNTSSQITEKDNSASELIPHSSRD